MRRSLRRLTRPLPLLLLFVLAACAKDAPQDALDCAGPLCEQADSLFRPVFWIAVAIFVLVEGLIVFAAIKFRDRGRGDEPKQVHGNTKLEIGWTVIPALLMLGVAIPTVITIFDITPVQAEDDVAVTVTAKQWWWEYEYTNVGEPNIITANELVIPTDRPVFLTLTSTDVIHSFWVPRLGGKQDVVPERENTLKLEAPEAGTYEGQCAEFCGISHANMRLRVRALPPNEFTSWVAEQQADAREPVSADAIAGRELFFDTGLLEQNSCINCHVIKGTDAAARVGPDLTHFASREMFAGAMFEVDDEDAVFDWIKNTRAMKPGVVMPVFEGLLTDEQIRQLTAYILSLE